MKETELEILQYSYWEHYKKAKDLALVHALDHPKRKAVEEELERIRVKLETLKKQ